MVRSVEGSFHEGRHCVPCIFLQSRRRSQRIVPLRGSCESLGMSWVKRFEVKQTGYMVFSAGDCQALMLLNRTIKIHVQNDEMTLEADTKLVEDVLETRKLVGARGVDSPRFRRNEEHTAQVEDSEKLTPAESTSYRMLVTSLKQ